MVLIALCVIFLIIAVAVTSGVIAGVRKKSSEISFREAMDLAELPVITFYNGDKKINFLLDTGSNISYLNESIVSSLVTESTGEESNIIGIEGNKVNCKICKMIIRRKNQEFEEEFSIADLDKAFSIVKKESGVQIHGILGSRFFEKYKYVLDFKDYIAYVR
jgi:predicted aspartyl protease|nr:MAG TPA: protease [Crassvirales sp.]